MFNIRLTVQFALPCPRRVAFTFLFKTKVKERAALENVITGITLWLPWLKQVGRLDGTIASNLVYAMQTW